MRNKVLGCLGVLVLLALFASVMLNIGLISSRFASGASALALSARKPEPFQSLELEPAAAGASASRIVRLDVDSIIHSGMVEDLKRALRQATEDRNVAALVLRINSPGGEVTASDTLYQAVKETASQKPVVVFMDSIAASGGYYIACGATKIVAHPTGITGSIGVIMQMPAYQELMSKVGVEMRTFKSGAMKDAGSGSRPMTDEEKHYFQTLIGQNYERFVSIVAQARQRPVVELKAGLADGRIFLGEQAKADGLVDETGYLEQAYEMARQLGNAPGAAVVMYERPFNWRGLASLLGEAETPLHPQRVELDVSSRLLPQLEPGRCYYLWPGATH